LVVVAVVAAALGYVLAAFGWRYFIARKRRRRLHKADQRRLASTSDAGSN
ncbi:MAG: hypothetical protein RLZZ58_186, partial [Pseudomonadota bacterium]